MLLSLLILQPNPVILNYDPPPADSWVQSVDFQCGRSTLRVAGYGAAYPVNRPVRITVDGLAITGSKVAALKADLSSRRAVFRLGVRCSKQTGEIGLVIDSGEKAADGQMRFRNGIATIRGRALVSYSGLEESNADTFWFR